MWEQSLVSNIQEECHRTQLFVVIRKNSESDGYDWLCPRSAFGSEWRDELFIKYKDSFSYLSWLSENRISNQNLEYLQYATSKKNYCVMMRSSRSFRKIHELVIDNSMQNLKSKVDSTARLLEQSCTVHFPKVLLYEFPHTKCSMLYVLQGW